MSEHRGLCFRSISWAPRYAALCVSLQAVCCPSCSHSPTVLHASSIFPAQTTRSPGTCTQLFPVHTTSVCSVPHVQCTQGIHRYVGGTHHTSSTYRPSSGCLGYFLSPLFSIETTPKVSCGDFFPFDTVTLVSLSHLELLQKKNVKKCCPPVTCSRFPLLHCTPLMGSCSFSICSFISLINTDQEMSTEEGNAEQVNMYWRKGVIL